MRKNALLGGKSFAPKQQFCSYFIESKVASPDLHVWVFIIVFERRGAILFEMARKWHIADSTAFFASL